MNGKQLKNSILQLAIQGKLVPQNADDEPASVLLDRIRAEKEQLVKQGKLKKKDLVTTPISDEEKPFEIPESWEWCRLGEIFSMQAGKTIKADELSLDSNLTHPYPCFGGNGIRGYIAKKNQQGNHCIIGRQGALCGNVKIATGDFYATEHAVVVDHYGGLNVKWAYFFLIASNLNQYATATAQPGLAVSNILETTILLPPLAEQHRIVSKIEELMPLVDEYDKAQRELDELNAKLPEALKKSILQEAIMGKLVPQNPDDEPASVLLERIRAEKEQLVKQGKLKKKDLVTTPISDEEKPFEIPESWEWCRLGEVSSYASTKKKINAANADKDLWELDLEDIEKGGRLIQMKTVGERKAIGDKTFFSKGNILYSKLRPYLLKILVAHQNGICTPEIVPFNCYGSINHQYIVTMLKSTYVDDYINSVTFGIKMPRVGTDTMTNLVLPLPPLAEQHRIVSKIEELMPLVEEYDKAQRKLDSVTTDS